MLRFVRSLELHVEKFRDGTLKQELKLVALPFISETKLLNKVFFSYLTQICMITTSRDARATIHNGSSDRMKKDVSRT
jgi:hypothetical protein